MSSSHTVKSPEWKWAPEEYMQSEIYEAVPPIQTLKQEVMELKLDSFGESNSFVFYIWTIKYNDNI